MNRPQIAGPEIDGDLSISSSRQIYDPLAEGEFSAGAEAGVDRAVGIFTPHCGGAVEGGGMEALVIDVQGGVHRPVVINRRIVERREIAAIDSAGGKQNARFELLHTDAEGSHDFSLKLSHTWEDGRRAGGFLPSACDCFRRRDMS